MITRRGFLKGVAGTVLAGLTLGGYAFGAEPALRLREQLWRLSPTGWTGGSLRIVALADLHLGEPYIGLARLKRIVGRVNALAPDLVLYLGDYTAGHRFISRPVGVVDAAPIMAQARGRLGTYAILGNHDWWDDREAQRRGGGPNLYAEAFRNAGIAVLSNSAVRVDGFWLAGLEDQLALRTLRGFRGLDDLPGTLAKITDDAPVVLMAHEPDIFPKIPDRVCLTLSGHTHGGQVRLLGWSPMVPSRYGNRYAWGHVREGARDLVVSGGIGCSIMPVRFGMPPEITIIDLS
ncbi:MAG: metallophosphoesterase [Pseudorhodobacter sp.]